MAGASRPKGQGRRIGQLLFVVAVAAVLFAALKDPRPLMALAAYGPLGMLAIVGWVLIVWITVKAVTGGPKDGPGG